MTTNIIENPEQFNKQQKRDQHVLTQLLVYYGEKNQPDLVLAVSGLQYH